MFRLLQFRRWWPVLPIALIVPLIFAAGAWFHGRNAPEDPRRNPPAPRIRTVVDGPAPPLDAPEADSSPDELREYARDLLTRAYDQVYEPFRSGLKDLRAEFESDVWGSGVFYWRAPGRFIVQLAAPRSGQNAAAIAQEIHDLFRGRRALLDEIEACSPAVSVLRSDIVLTLELAFAAGLRPSSGPRTVKHRTLVLDSRPVLQRQVIQYADGGRDEVSYVYDYLSNQLVATGAYVLSNGRSSPLQLRQTYTTHGSIRMPMRHLATTPEGRDLTLLRIGDFEINKGFPDSVFTAARPPAGEK